ncbi:MAG: MaoC family dehydratase [Candidatus Rokuibacteriota bacterium]
MPADQPPRRVYFEDVQTGVPLETPAMTLTETHAALFASLTTTRPGDPGAIPDLLPLCISSGLGWRVPQPPLVVLAFMGFEWRFLKPTRVGDTIRSVSKTVAKRSMKEGGVVVEERTILNQDDEVVQSGRLTLLVAKRPAA